MKKVGLSVLLLCVAAVFASCDEDYLKADKPLKNSLSAKYPTAKFATWEQNGPYAVADCKIDGHSAEVWFQLGTNAWVMTNFDYLYKQLPDAVAKAFEVSENKLWRVDDIDVVERASTDSVFYILELESGSLEKDVYYLSDGTFVKEVAEAWNEMRRP